MLDRTPQAVTRRHARAQSLVFLGSFALLAAVSCSDAFSSAGEAMSGSAGHGGSEAGSSPTDAGSDATGGALAQAGATGEGGVASGQAGGPSTELLEAAPPWDGKIERVDVAPPAIPPRVIFFYTPHGTVLDAWRPSGSETDFQLSTILEPLAPFQSDLIIADGIVNEAVPGVVAQTHESAASTLLTAYLGAGHVGSQGPYYPAGGPSAEVLFGAVFGGLPSSVQQGVRSVAQHHDTSPVLISYDNADAALEPLEPAAAHVKLFGPPAPAELEALDVASDGNFTAIFRAQANMLTLALASGKTRCATIMLGDLDSAASFSFIAPAITRGYHELADGSAAGDARDQFVLVQRYFAEQYAYLLQQLKNVALEEGNLLDHTAVVWLSDTGEASSHEGRSIPVVVAGFRQHFKLGRYLKLEQHTQADLLVTLARRLGIQTLGDPRRMPQPIDAFYN